MKLEDLKRLAAQRTSGEWKHEPERYSAKHVIARSKDEPWIAHASPEFNGESNAEWIAAINNSADKLIAVVEAAKAYKIRQDAWGYSGKPVDGHYESWLELDRRLAALEES